MLIKRLKELLTSQHKAMEPIRRHRRLVLTPVLGTSFRLIGYDDTEQKATNHETRNQ